MFTFTFSVVWAMGFTFGAILGGWNRRERLRVRYINDIRRLLQVKPAASWNKCSIFSAFYLENLFGNCYIPRNSLPKPHPIKGLTMLANVRSAALLGIDAYAVEVEVDIAPGL